MSPGAQLRDDATAVADRFAVLRTERRFMIVPVPEEHLRDILAGVACLTMADIPADAIHVDTYWSDESQSLELVFAHESFRSTAPGCLILRTYTELGLARPLYTMERLLEAWGEAWGGAKDSVEYRRATVKLDHALAEALEDQRGKT